MKTISYIVMRTLFRGVRSWFGNTFRLKAERPRRLTHDRTPAATAAEATTAFEHAAKEIRFFKGQQWRVTYYALLADGTVAVLMSQPQMAGASGFVRGSLAALLAGGAAWIGFVLWDLAAGIKTERARMEAARMELPTLADIHQVAKRPPGADHVQGLFYAAVIFGWLITSLVIVGSDRA